MRPLCLPTFFNDSAAFFQVKCAGNSTAPDFWPRTKEAKRKAEALSFGGKGNVLNGGAIGAELRQLAMKEKEVINKGTN